MDPISDMFIRLINAQKAGHEMVRLTHSKFKYEIAKALEREGMIKRVERKGKRVKKTLELELLYRQEKPAMNGVKLLSKPSNRLYSPYRKLVAARRGGIVLMSTPKGVMSAKQAKVEKLGGMLIAEVW